ncbi:MAG: hypothetical protein NZ922_06670 [Candidatus Methanomethyliaceae archaeon]|nr:hypothetical protein [Candidatus Methanomethyliaceae archaeon]MDW7971150.1 hypothetical protein [Nitrososphaerota archaeon]
MEPVCELGKFLYCSFILEEKVAKAYEHLSKIFKDEPISSLFNFIAYDSFKHAICFKIMSNNLGVDICNCEEFMGKAWKDVISHAERFLEKSEISKEEILSIINNLEKLENFASEEYLMLISARLIDQVSDDSIIDQENYKCFIEWVMEDENKHKKILMMIKELLKEKS